MAYVVEADIPCPWCGEVFGSTVDTSQGDYTTIEDCAVCCRPIQISVQCQPGELESVDASRG